MKKHAPASTPATTTPVASTPDDGALPFFARARALGGIAIRSHIKAGRNAEQSDKITG